MRDDLLTKSILGCYTAENKICTFERMFSICNCSEATLRRRINQIQLLVSYNHNSRFYTLSSFADFDKYPGKAVRYLPAPPQTRTNGFSVSGSLVVRFALKKQKVVQ